MMLILSEIEVMVNELAQRIKAPQGILPTYTTPEMISGSLVGIYLYFHMMWENNAKMQWLEEQTKDC